jgi:hypothetical protein
MKTYYNTKLSPKKRGYNKKLNFISEEKKMKNMKKLPYNPDKTYQDFHF